MSLAKYRVFDLFLISIVGIVSEIAGCYLINFFVPVVIPVFVASFIIIYVAIMRWGIWGLLEIPIMALSTYIAITFVIPNTKVSEEYQQITQYFITILGFDLTGALWIIPKCLEMKGKHVVDTIPKRIGIEILIYLIGTILCSFLLLIYKQNLFISLTSLLGEQLMSLVITIVVIEIMHSFSVIYDVKQSFIDKKKELEYEKKYYLKNKE